MSGSYRGAPPQNRKPIMSLEAAMEEERIEVEALIAARNNRSQSALSNPRSSSPFTARSPVRSMLDIGEHAHHPPRATFGTLPADTMPFHQVQRQLDSRKPPSEACSTWIVRRPRPLLRRVSLARQPRPSSSRTSWHMPPTRHILDTCPTPQPNLCASVLDHLAPTIPLTSSNSTTS